MGVKGEKTEGVTNTSHLGATSADAMKPWESLQ
jgi:hypothetical protein